MRTDANEGGVSTPTVDISGLSLGILDALPVAMFLVDREFRIVWANDLARRWLSTDDACVELLRAGNALHCAQAAETGACGAAPSCDRCELRQAVARAFAGRQTSRRRTRLHRQTPTGVQDIHLQVTTIPLPESADFVLLALQDITELVQLQGLIPICANCKSVRDDNRYWRSVEQYLRDRLDAQFTHGLCPDCVRELYADELGLST